MERKAKDFTEILKEQERLMGFRSEDPDDEPEITPDNDLEELDENDSNN